MKNNRDISYSQKIWDIFCECTHRDRQPLPVEDSKCIEDEHLNYIDVPWHEIHEELPFPSKSQINKEGQLSD